MKTNKEVEEGVVEVKENIFDIFLRGQRKGWKMATNGMIPNIMMAFIIIKILNLTGLMNVLGVLFAPFMRIVGLPGEAAAGLIFGWMSMAGGVGAIAGLYESGLVNPTQITIIAPAIMLMGAQLQYMGRLLGGANIKKKYYIPIFAISIINAFISMIIMNVIA